MATAKRILVVDDDPTVRESCERIFGEEGYDVETAATGKEGLERTRLGYYDCALVDLKMPDMHGMEVVRSARQALRGEPGSVGGGGAAGRIGLYL